MSDPTMTAPKASGGINWDNLMQMMGGFLKKPENQRMIADIGQQLAMGPIDPRTGRRTQGIGSGLAGAASGMINREQVGNAAAMQAERQQAYQKAMLQMLSQYGKPAAVAQSTMPQANPFTSDDWLRAKGIAAPIGGGY